MPRLAVLLVTLGSLTGLAAGSAPDLYRQSYAAEARGDAAAALQALEELGAADYVVHLRRGWLLHQLGRSADSVAAYRKAMALEPRAVEPRLGVTLPLMALRRWSETEQACLEALALAPGDYTALSRAAYASFQLGRWAKAAAGYRAALVLYPADVEMQAGLGWALMRQGKGAEARAALERVLAVAPDHLSAREGLALLPTEAVAAGRRVSP
jgi:tetratricopeptide (TPR) repeat protein